MKRLAIIVPALLLAVAACGSDSSSSDSATIAVTGNLVYLQKIALVPDGTATVTLEDVSVADAASTVIAAQTIDLGDQQVPIPFELTVDTTDLEPSGMYSVRASINAPDGSLAWTTDTAHIIDPESTDDIDLDDLVLVQVAPTSGDPVAAGDASALVGTWNVTDIDGEGVTVDPPITLVFGDDGSLSGNAGCNAYTTSYTIDGNRLVLEPIASTMMACIGDAAEPEVAFLAILDDAPTYELLDTDLLLMIESASGSMLSAER